MDDLTESRLNETPSMEDDEMTSAVIESIAMESEERPTASIFPMNDEALRTALRRKGTTFPLSHVKSGQSGSCHRYMIRL